MLKVLTTQKKKKNQEKSNCEVTSLWQSFHNIYMYQIIALYTLTLHNVTCELRLNKAGFKKECDFSLFGN